MFSRTRSCSFSTSRISSRRFRFFLHIVPLLMLLLESLRLLFKFFHCLRTGRSGDDCHVFRPKEVYKVGIDLNRTSCLGFFHRRLGKLPNDSDLVSIWQSAQGVYVADRRVSQPFDHFGLLNQMRQRLRNELGGDIPRRSPMLYIMPRYRCNQPANR
jgi:hypothetical protein